MVLETSIDLTQLLALRRFIQFQFGLYFRSTRYLALVNKYLSDT